MSMPPFPIRPYKANMPSDLDGETNGKVPAGLLVDIGVRKSKMHHTAARGWRCLMWHAERAGFVWDLASIDPRTYEQQVLIFDGRAYPTSGRYLPEEMWSAAGNAAFVSPIDVRTWNGERWKRRRGTASAAIPGTSPHGWALAVDLAERWPDGHYPPRSISEAFARWLVADDIALRCGFGWSLQSEPWHLQWYVGDDVPAFVLAWERQQAGDPDPQPDPDPNPTEDDMAIKLLRPTDCDAQFLGMADRNGNLVEVVWADKQRADAHIAAGADIDDGLSFGGLINCVLLGPLPVGDTRHEWTGAEFFRVVT